MPKIVRSSQFVAHKSKGFTLIELLVVISIIAILTTIGLVSYLEFSKKGRDAKRQADLGGIQSALQQYNSDHGFYPLLNAGGCNTNGTFKVDCALTNVSYATNPKTYLNKIPKEPVATNNQYCFVALPSGCNNAATKCTNYELYATLEKPPASPPSYTCSGVSYNLKVGPP